MDNFLQNQVNKIMTDSFNELKTAFKNSDKRSKNLIKYIDTNLNYTQTKILTASLKENKCEKIIPYFDKMKYDEIFQYLLKNFNSKELFTMCNNNFNNHKTYKLLLHVYLEKKEDNEYKISTIKKASYIAYSLIDFNSFNYDSEDKSNLVYQTKNSDSGYKHILSNNLINKQEFTKEIVKRLTIEDLNILIKDGMINYLDDKSINDLLQQTKKSSEDILKINFKNGNTYTNLIDIALKTKSIDNPIKNMLKNLQK